MKRGSPTPRTPVVVHVASLSGEPARPDGGGHPAPAAAPGLSARIEQEVVERLSSEVTAALRKRPPNEERLAGALRVLAGRSEALRSLLDDAGRALLRRGMTGRPLFEAAARALSESGDPRAEALVQRALSPDAPSEGPGLLALLSAAGSCGGDELGETLRRLAASRQPHVALAAGVARLERGDARGDGLAGLALRLKEAHRVAFCGDILEPFARRAAPAPALLPALAVLRDAERYLGRWLLLADVSVRAGDERPRQHAQAQAASGPASARGAWGLVGWALSRASTPPPQRASLDVLLRLSDRPSAERDLSFLFRLAEARAPQLRLILDGLAARLAQADESAIRAAFYLARDHARDDLRASLLGLLRSRREGAWGLVAAALHDLGDSAAAAAADACLRARSPAALAWGALVASSLAAGGREPLLTEPHVRRLHAGLLA